MAPRRLERLPFRDLAGGVRVYEAATPAARLLGLAGLNELPAGRALMLRRCHAVHTFGMRFAVDLVFLDRHDEFVCASAGVAPGRMVACRASRSVVETPVGEAGEFLQAWLRRRNWGTEL